MEAADWVNLSDDQLLEKKISQLGLKLESAELQPLVQQLYDELSQKGLAFHPPCHVGDEWFVPVGIPAIFIARGRLIPKTGGSTSGLRHERLAWRC